MRHRNLSVPFPHHQAKCAELEAAVQQQEGVAAPPVGGPQEAAAMQGGGCCAQIVKLRAMRQPQPCKAWDAVHRL